MGGAQWIGIAPSKVDLWLLAPLPLRLGGIPLSCLHTLLCGWPSPKGPFALSAPLIVLKYLGPGIRRGGSEVDEPEHKQLVVVMFWAPCEDLTANSLVHVFCGSQVEPSF